MKVYATRLKIHNDKHGDGRLGKLNFMQDVKEVKDMNCKLDDKCRKLETFNRIAVCLESTKEPTSLMIPWILRLAISASTEPGFRLLQPHVMNMNLPEDTA